MTKKPPQAVESLGNALAAVNPAFKPKHAAQEVAALRNLTAFMNNPEISGAVAPPQQTVVADPMPAAPEPAKAEVTKTSLGDQSKIFFTGRLKSGKDHLASACGAKIFGFADPLYFLFERCFGVKVNKDLPGAREWLQTIGQWGRALVNSKYPMTPARSIFTIMIRLQAGALAQERPDLKVLWERFGIDPSLWLDACLKRAQEWIEANPGQRTAITNARFSNEIDRLKAEGWSHWHVMCSPKTHAERLKASKLAPNSPAVTDVSEASAIGFDQSVARLLKSTQRGSMLRVVWSDERVNCPSPRIYTVNQWLQELAILETPASLE